MTNSVNNVGKSRQRKRRLWRWLAALLGLPLFLILLVSAYAWWAGNRELNHLVAEIDREDPNWRQAHLERRPMPPPEFNGMAQVLDGKQFSLFNQEPKATAGRHPHRSFI